MITYPNAKINIGLNITAKRPDGYHNIETLFYPIPLCDVLEFIPTDKTTLTIQGLPINNLQGDNLIIKALHSIQNRHNIPELAIFLQKNIPMGAGLGGGSSDAAFMLKMLNEEFKLKMNDTSLEQVALSIGADCPFFIKNRPTLAYGLGNEFSSIDFSMKGKWIILIKPDIHIDTKKAYASVTPSPWNIPLIDILQMPRTHWPEHLRNDFEIPIFKQYPNLRKIKGMLYELGAFYASMSGSGSTIYGLFDHEIEISKESLPENTQLFIRQLTT